MLSLNLYFYSIFFSIPCIKDARMIARNELHKSTSMWMTYYDLPASLWVCKKVYTLKHAHTLCRMFFDFVLQFKFI